MNEGKGFDSEQLRDEEQIEGFKETVRKIEEEIPSTKENKEKIVKIKNEIINKNWRTVAFSLAALFSSYFVNVSKAEAGGNKYKELPKKPAIKQTVKHPVSENPMGVYSEPVLLPDDDRKTPYKDMTKDYSEPMVPPNQSVESNKTTKNYELNTLPENTNTRTKNPMDEYSEPMVLPKK